MNPLTLVSMGLGTAGNLYQGVRNTMEAPARKRRFLGDAHRDARITALRNQRHSNMFPTNAIDARYKADAVRREARENPAFQADPMAFVPFLGSATQLAGGLYDFANQPTGPKPYSPEMLKPYDDPMKAVPTEGVVPGPIYKDPENPFEDQPLRLWG